MKKVIKLFFAAVLGVALLGACKPTLSPSEIAESDYYAKITLTINVTCNVPDVSEPVAVSQCPISVTRGDGNTYEFKCDRNGTLVHTFPVNKPADKDATLGDVYTIKIDYDTENDSFGHLVATKSESVTIKKGEKHAEKTIDIKCAKK